MQEVIDSGPSQPLTSTALEELAAETERQKRAARAPHPHLDLGGITGSAILGLRNSLKDMQDGKDDEDDENP